MEEFALGWRFCHVRTMCGEKNKEGEGFYLIYGNKNVFEI